MNEKILRHLLREWIDEDYRVLEIGEFEDSFDASGKLIPPRDEYRQRYESRLAGLLRIVPDRTDLQEEHRVVIAALNAISPDERLYYWEIATVTRQYAGVACLGGIIVFYGPRPSSGGSG